MPKQFNQRRQEVLLLSLYLFLFGFREVSVTCAIAPTPSTTTPRTSTPTTTTAIRRSMVSSRRPFTTNVVLGGSSSGLTDKNNHQPEKEPVIRNFRQAYGIGNVYRCASTDVLGDKVQETTASDGNDTNDWSSSDRFVYEQAGLVIDLRSPSERDNSKAQSWIKRAPQGPMKIIETDQDYKQPNGDIDDDITNSQPCRCVMRIDVLKPSKFMTYVEESWLSGPEKAQATFFKIVDGQKLHELRIDALNQRGLAGLNEAILEIGKYDIFRALRAITLHLENKNNGPVVIHCVQGKDRTGMLVMLLQSILGLSDTEIIEDYYMSNRMLQNNNNDNESSAAAQQVQQRQQRGRLNRSFFGGTNREAMITTLQFLRTKYKSVSPGYLDSIGFDSTWRERLLNVLDDSRRSKL